MGLACDVYTRLMLPRGHGYPLWEPEPTESGEVLIGDVGYVLDGGFYRLFNATLPPDHPIHKRWGVPDGYEIFSFSDALLHHRPNALAAGAICSRNVLAINVEGSADVGLISPGPSLSGKLRFKCADEQGAMLVLKHDATRDDLHPSKDLKQYIIRNHDSWFRFAQDVFRLDLPQHRIIFISGSVKTAEWALAAVTHCTREGEIAFSGAFAPAAKAAFSVGGVQEVSMSVEQRCGPKRLPADSTSKSESVRDEREDLANTNISDGQGDASAVSALKADQCVFVHYYKLKRRHVLGPKVIRAASEVPSSPAARRRSPSAEEPSEKGVEASSADIREDMPALDVSLGSGSSELYHTRKEEFTDPVENILDYILHNTDAMCAIASDDDLKLIGLGESTLHDTRDVDTPGLLWLRKPQITVTHDGDQLVKRKRGRPPGSKNKKSLAAETAGYEKEGGEPSEEPPKKKRARPHKNPLPAFLGEPAGAATSGPLKTRSKQGKGNSHHTVTGSMQEPSTAGPSAASPATPKRKRGRPRKNGSRNDVVQVQPAGSGKGKGRLHARVEDEPEEDSEERPRKRVKRDYHS
ncbi:hypothetical protein C8Q80DRAFT_1116867 [Daedaleopsis nitida]|nr:hypothetical protein C8Q80DRAFT_1116867 [Daedaleopsis nitida]